jgi:hypothetical protein
VRRRSPSFVFLSPMGLQVWLLGFPWPGPNSIRCLGTLVSSSTYALLGHLQRGDALSARVRFRHSVETKMIVFVRTSVYVWGWLQRDDAVFLSTRFFFSLLHLNIVPNITY